MKINKIILHNFNSYEGINEFVFTSHDSHKNIILIGGKNGAGKTSLFSAIKIAFYGPLAFGYVGANSHYIAKIKECINSKAYQQEIVQSKVQITISLMIEREVKEYELTREWDYTRQKLEETYYIKEEGILLDENQRSYFQNYLQGLISPDLFEFFLFDGEEVGSIFSSSSYNLYVKKAIYTLFGLDIFEIIRKYTDGYVGKALNQDEEILYNQYQELHERADFLERQIAMLEEQIALNQEMLEQVETELYDLETAFKNEGGITEVERHKLIKEFNDAERIKTESVTQIKMFVEGLMPFLIVKDFTQRIANQLDYEEKGEIFYYIQQKLKKSEIKAVLNEKSDVCDESVDALMEFLQSKFKPKGFKEDIQPLHDLSKEDIGRVNAMISSLEDFDVQMMISLVNKRKAVAERTAEINRVLKRSMADEDARKYAGQENNLLKKKEELAGKLYEEREQESRLTEEYSNVIQQKDKIFESLKKNAQNKHVLELSSGLNQMMDTMLSNKVLSIKRKLEKLIVEKLHHIYRKDNLITHIEIEDNFRFNLYQDARYTVLELAYLIRNLGSEEFLSEIGEQGKCNLFELYKVSSLADLQLALSMAKKDTEINLYKRIDINRLSKGERQIFVLSFYWAIIELSGWDIPFVIDTPYARIDANHRKEISEKFFPKISKQVIILSTDEEINEEYYELIKPYVAKEFLLINDENQNRSTVEQHYFFGE
jgi:DNA sulfur modification protein DndD